MKQTITTSLIALIFCGLFFLYNGIPAGANPPSPGGASVAESHIKTARAELKAAKKALGSDYNCCIEPECDFCALADGKCICADNVSKGKAICGNCYDGWKAGRGQVPNVDVTKIQTLSPDQAKQLFDKLATAK